MLIPNGDGTYTGGPLDVIVIYHNVGERTFHPAFYEEAPPPGPFQEVKDMTTVRLKSRMHHSTGFGSFEEAQANVRDELRVQITLPDVNVVTETALPWNGVIGDVWIVQNWRHGGVDRSFSEVNLTTAQAV